MAQHSQGHLGSFVRPPMSHTGSQKPGLPFVTGGHYNNGSAAPGFNPMVQHNFANGVLMGPSQDLFASMQPPTPQMVPSRDQMKDHLAESLAADKNISIIPGFSPQLHSQSLNSKGFPAYIMHNSTTSRSPAQYNAVRNVQPIQNPDFQNAGFNMTKPPATGGTSHINSTVYYTPTWSEPVRFQGLSPTGTSNNAQMNFRRGRSGSWAHFGSTDHDAKNTPEAKAKRESYRHELEKQIEQAKVRRQEEERREKDLNDHPLGSNYAQPKQYSHSKFQSASSTALGISCKTRCYDDQVDVPRVDTQQPTRSRSQPRHSPHQLEQIKCDNGRSFRRQDGTEMDPPQQNFSCPVAPPPPWPPIGNPPLMPFPYPPPFFHPVQPPFPGSALPMPMAPPPMVPLPSPRLPPPINQPPLWQPPPGPSSPHTLESCGDSAVNERLESNFSQGAPNEEVDNLENAEEILRQHTWQTSDQLPDPALKVAIYKEELRRQIIQKKKDEEARALKEKEEEEKLERKIREYEERMQREVVEEKNRIYARSGCRVNQVEHARRSKELTEGDRIRLEESMRQEERRRELEDRKAETQVFQEYIRDGRGDNHEVTKMTERSNSPPIPTLQKRLQSRQCNSYRFQDSSRLSSAENKNLCILSDMLNSLDLETRRIERAIRRKMNY